MLNARDLLDRQFLTMRERILSLAADFDRIERAKDGKTLLQSDPAIAQLRQALEIVLSHDSARAQRVQMLLSDRSPAPTAARIRVSD